MENYCDNFFIGFGRGFIFAIINFEMIIPGVGPAYAKRLEKLEIKTVNDLLYHLPFRYEDYSLISKIKNLQAGETVTVRGKVLEIKNQYTRGSFILQRALVEDETGVLEVLWFNQRFLTKTIYKNDQISLSGKIEKNGKRLVLKSPVYELESQIHTGRLVPIYPETAGLTSKWLRTKIFNLLDNSVPEALKKVHFPKSLEEAEEARLQLAFDELLASQLEAIKRKKERENKTVGNKFKIVEIREKLKIFVDNLPFKLTGGQKKVIDAIYKDLAKDTPMNRLLQGDVGSGKTVVAALAMLAANLNGYQAVLMAPTEILANQHFETLKLLNLNVGIATGSQKENLDSKIIVGTHALLNLKPASPAGELLNIGLVVIDEQHRFGVEQQTKLKEKGINPHILTMTATPIPRALALTLYGDLDISLLEEMPVGRLPVKTWVVPEPKRQAAYDWIRKQQTQTFIICPFIEESETLFTVKSAKKEFENLAKNIFPDLKLGLIHGKLKPQEKDEILEKFKNKKLDILVATPVVEVGIDIPNATIMVIEAAERFGLAQLHQLRGRVGRSDKQSYCLLFAEKGLERLKSLEKINNGLALAEIDLRFRGPGERFGQAQHGHWALKIATFADFEKLFPLLQKRLAESKI
ncbi:ATP-dependent DNA helicase RecG [Candidatus Gottesmanbacteria bacterium]|nr:ATP-dependent DNA helicase RecG [Candidatus Gottesmanbacteria bacterium]